MTQPSQLWKAACAALAQQLVGLAYALGVWGWQPGVWAHAWWPSDATTPTAAAATPCFTFAPKLS